MFINVMRYFSIVLLGVFVAGSFAYKMIAVETIHLYQLILLLVVRSNAYPYLFIYFSQFSILYG